MTDAESGRRVAPGTTVYDDAGEAIGTVRAVDDDGCYVTVADGVDTRPVDREPGAAAHATTWRCSGCGAIGSLDDGLPADCPECDAARELLYYRLED